MPAGGASSWQIGGFLSQNNATGNYKDSVVIVRSLHGAHKMNACVYLSTYLTPEPLVGFWLTFLSM